MTELVESLLTLARADEGRAPLPVERTDLRDLVAEASETAGMLAESGHLKVTTVMPEEPVVGHGGPATHPGDAAQPGDQRDQVHAGGGQGGTVARRRERMGRPSSCATPASASPPMTCPTSSTGSGGRTWRARGPASGRAAAWGSPSPSGLRRRMAGRSRRRAGPAGVPRFTVVLPAGGVSSRTDTIGVS